MQTVILIETCSACPTQWEGKDDYGNDYYVRYRWGYLSFRVNGEEVFGAEVGDGLDGVISFHEMKYLVEKTLKNLSLKQEFEV